MCCIIVVAGAFSFSQLPYLCNLHHLDDEDAEIDIGSEDSDIDEESEEEVPDDDDDDDDDDDNDGKKENVLSVRFISVKHISHSYRYQ